MAHCHSLVVVFYKYSLYLQHKAGEIILHVASQEQQGEYVDVSSIRCFLDMGYDINIKNTQGKTPLYVAIEQGMLAHAI